MAESQTEVRYYRMDEIMRLAGFKTKQTVYNWMKRGMWPRQIKWGARAIRWPSDEIHAVCDALKAGKSEDEICAIVKQGHAARTAAAPA